MHRWIQNHKQLQPKTSLASSMPVANKSYSSKQSAATKVFQSKDMCNYIMRYSSFFTIMAVFPALTPYTYSHINSNVQAIRIIKEYAKFEFGPDIWCEAGFIGKHRFKFESNREFTQYMYQLFGDFESFHNNLHDFESTYSSDVSTVYNFDKIGEVRSASFVWFWFQKVFSILL